MKKRVWLFLALALVLLAVAAVFLDPTHVVRGYLRGEPFYRDRPVSYWSHALKSRDPMMQVQALTALQDGGKKSVPVLVTLLRENSAGDWEATEVRWKAASLLGELREQGQEAVPDLVEALRDDDPHVRTVAATSLGAIAPPESAGEVVPALIAVVEAGGPASAAAARSLGRFGPEAAPALPALEEAMKAPEAEVRWSTAQTLGKLGPAAREAVPLLVTALKDREARVREHAAEALGEIGPEAREGVPALVEVLDDPVPRVRRDAVRALGQMGAAARPALPKLKKLLEDGDAQVRQAATRAVRLVGR